MSIALRRYFSTIYSDLSRIRQYTDKVDPKNNFSIVSRN